MFGIWAILLFIALILLNVPVSFSMGIAAAITLGLMGVSGTVLPQQIMAGIESWTLLAVPFFILAAQIMNYGGITKRLFDFANELVGWIKGGLAHTNVLASMIFAGISGAAVADASGLGLVEIKAMTDAGYDKGFAAGVTAASCMLGPIIPPSIMLILYGHIAELSIAALWFAGIIPGVITGLLLMVYIYYLAATGKVYAPPPRRFSLRRTGRSFVANFPALVLPPLLLYSIVGGWASPTETGLIACLYAFILALIYEGRKFLKDFPQVLLSATKSTAVIMFLIGTAKAIVWVITREQTAVVLTNALLSITSNKYLVILLINLILLIIGSLLEQVPALLIVVPLFAPLAPQLGVNPIQFGLMVVFNLMIGMITPPMGMALYIMRAITDVPMKDIIKHSVRFLPVLIIALLLIAYIPELSLFIPRMLGFI